MKTIEEELSFLYKQRDDLNNTILSLEKKLESMSSFKFILQDKVYIPLRFLSQELLQELKQLATFDNPQIKILQQLRRPIYNTPKKIISYELMDNTLILPRGLMRDLILLLNNYGLEYKIIDKRVAVKEKFPKIKFTLRDAQQKVVDHLEKKISQYL